MKKLLMAGLLPFVLVVTGCASLSPTVQTPHKIAPILSDGEWHNIKGVGYRQASSNDQHPRLFVEYYNDDSSYVIYKVKYDCSNNRSSPETGVKYAKNGTVKDTYQFSKDRWHDAIPDSPGVMGLFLACGKKI